MRRTFHMLFVFGLFEYAFSQYLTIGSNKKPSKSTCEPSAKSSLVEHFFNIIFTEFHNTPPVCVCVQMCPEQPTYCYPNGCLKRAEKNKKVDVPLPVTRISDNPIFFIDEKNDFMNEFLAKNYIDDSKPVTPSSPAKPDNPPPVNMRPDPFKDRYKILFKYKKMPKVELKYNLGEQVKNMRSESVDVSKTRWPMNKIDRRLGGQRIIYNEPHVQKTTTNPRYFMSIFPDKDVASYPPKYFKRELPNNSSNEEDGVDIKAIYVVGKSESESSIFSLEKLIDSLIESSFDNTTTTKPDIDLDTDYKTAVNKTVIEIRQVTQTLTTTENIIKVSTNNETTNVISMNFTNENVDKNKYSDDNNNKSNTVSEMIATLSKRIDIQNNTSLEMMRRITGDFEFESMNTTTEKPIEVVNSNTSTTTTIVNSNTTTTESVIAPMDSETKTTKKSRQRLVKRLQNSKNN